MEYQVPQFIEVEDRIIGPLTMKQFIYIAGAVGICVISFVYLPIFLALLVAAPIVALAAALAFYKMNGKPFIEILEAGFNYYTRAKLFLWKHKDIAAQNEVSTTVTVPTPRHTPKLTRGKLSELAWSLDVKPSGDNPANRES